MYIPPTANMHVHMWKRTPNDFLAVLVEGLTLIPSIYTREVNLLQEIMRREPGMVETMANRKTQALTKGVAGHGLGSANC